MDSKEIKSLMEAYAEVYAPKEEVNEAVKGADPEMRKAAAAERKAGDKPLPAKEGEKFAKFKASQISYIDKKTKGKYIPGMTREEVEQVDEATDDPIDVDFKIQRLPNNKTPKPTPQQTSAIAAALKLRARAKASKKVDEGLAQARKNEELDIFDVVLKFLQAEGIAETIEEAKWAMANLLSKEEIAIIVEAMHEDEEEDKKEMKKEKKGKKEKEEEDEEEEDEEENIKEATYSAKAARAGKDIGKPGKMFAKIAASAGKRYGSKERGEKVAGAVLAKLRAKKG